MLVQEKKDYYKIISSLVIIGAFLVVLVVSLLSEFGIHPDEYDVRVCMDWSMKHWIWPDMRLQGEGLGDTYSLYGYTKVCNYTVYFLVMSKIAFVFKLFMGAWPYFRMPNLLLAVFMLVIMLKSVGQKRYLMLAFGMCAQAWYIFSYVTADALDFVFAFMAVYFLADEKSVLWRVIQSEKKETFKCIGLGILYGMILLGKPYYYSVLVLIFIVLVYNLVKSEKSKRPMIWRKYILILSISCAIFAARYGLDVYYYGTDKAQVKEEMMEKFANYDKKPSTPVEEQVQTYHAYEKGYPLSFIFEDDPHWFAESFRSYVSARITKSGDDWYFVSMAILYLIMYFWVAFELKKKNNTWILIAGTLLMIGGIVASVLNSYFIDSQPQGRYLLPLALVFSFMASRAEDVWKNKKFCILVLLCGCLSVAYFGLFDLRKLIDLAYVRSLF